MQCIQKEEQKNVNKKKPPPELITTLFMEILFVFPFEIVLKLW
jgi:hypothetical protein